MTMNAPNVTLLFPILYIIVILSEKEVSFTCVVYGTPTRTKHPPEHSLKGLNAS